VDATFAFRSASTIGHSLLARAICILDEYIVCWRR
jgi:hypothetical protein